MFVLPDADMELIDIARFQGRNNLILFFYPRDDAPCCTLQATDFSDHEDEFARRDFLIFGISREGDFARRFRWGGATWRDPGRRVRPSAEVRSGSRRQRIDLDPRAPRNLVVAVPHRRCWGRGSYHFVRARATSPRRRDGWATLPPAMRCCDVSALHPTLAVSCGPSR